MQQQALRVRAQVCLVLQMDDEVQTLVRSALVLNRPMASRVNLQLARQLLFGSRQSQAGAEDTAGATSKDTASSQPAQGERRGRRLAWTGLKRQQPMLFFSTTNSTHQYPLLHTTTNTRRCHTCAPRTTDTRHTHTSTHHITHTTHHTPWYTESTLHHLN